MAPLSVIASGTYLTNAAAGIYAYACTFMYISINTNTHKHSQTHTHRHKHIHTIIIRIIKIDADAVHACDRYRERRAACGLMRCSPSAVKFGARVRRRARGHFAAHLRRREHVRLHRAVAELARDLERAAQTNKQTNKQTHKQTSAKASAALRLGRAFALQMVCPGFSERSVTSGCIGMQRTFNSPHQQAH